MQEEESDYGKTWGSIINRKDENNVYARQKALGITFDNTASCAKQIAYHENGAAWSTWVRTIISDTDVCIVGDDNGTSAGGYGAKYYPGIVFGFCLK